MKRSIEVTNVKSTDDDKESEELYSNPVLPTSSGPVIIKLNSQLQPKKTYVLDTMHPLVKT